MLRFSKTVVTSSSNWEVKPALVIIALTGLVVCTLLVPIVLPRPVVQAQTSPTTTPPTATPAASNNDQANRSDLLLLQAQIQNQAQQLQQAQQDVLDSKNSAGAAVTLSLLGIFFGVLGLVIGALALLRSRPHEGNGPGKADNSEAG